MVVTNYTHACRIATRLKRDMRKYNGITIGILQAQLEMFDICDLCRNLSIVLYAV